MTQKFAKLLFLLLFAFAYVHGQDSTTSGKQKNGIAAIPMINYNRTQGIILGAIVSKYYKINMKDTMCAGLRFRMLPSEKVNIGVDAGVGKGDYSITFRIGEAFGR